MKDTKIFFTVLNIVIIALSLQDSFNPQPGIHFLVEAEEAYLRPITGM